MPTTRKHGVRGARFALSATVLLVLAACAGEPERAPGPLRIASAGIQQLRPIDPENLIGRKVKLVIAFQGEPRCGPEGKNTTLGFAVDADRNPKTGLSHPAFAGLGVEARIGAQCNPDTGEFESPLGSVTLTRDRSTKLTTVEILTIAGFLPSVDFFWIAFATDGDDLVRLPPAPEYGRWVIFERALF